MSLPISTILKQLESSPDSIIPILSSLHNDKSILANLSKSETKHLVLRTLNLARSPNVYSKWCGINLLRVVVDNYTVLANEGVSILGQLVKNLESYNETIDIKILNSTVEALNFTANKIRGKPTLTRELLTPRLSNIISLLLEKLHYNPLVVIKSLRILIQAHPTTFRPFGNKLKARLISLLNLPEFVNYPFEVKEVIYETLAFLPVIEKNDPELVWSSQVGSLIKEIVSVLAIYNEFLNIGEDGDLVKLIRRLPTSDETKLLEGLAIDLNDPSTILSVSTKIDILVNLLRVYITSETAFGVKVPIGQIVILSEVISLISLKFLSFKYDVSLDVAQNLVKATILKNQQNILRLLTAMAHTYKGNMLPHLSNILSFLEILLPFRNKKFDLSELLSQEDFHCELLICVEAYLSIVSLIDNTQLLKFVDVALLLVEPRSEQKPPGVLNKQIQHSGKRHNQKKKKAQVTVPLSDLLSHQHLFSEQIPSGTSYSVRKFINAIVTKVNLPPTQHYKIMRYLLIETINAKHYNLEHEVPTELRELLVNAVLNPGFEKISLLPIVSSLIPDDPVLSVFNNPRFPPLAIYLKKQVDDEEYEEEEEDEEDEPELKRRKVDSETEDIEIEEIPLVEVDSTKLFTSSTLDESSVLKFAARTERTERKTTTTTENGVETEVETVVETIEPIEIEIENDEDFEMPEIDIGDESE